MATGRVKKFPFFLVLLYFLSTILFHDQVKASTIRDNVLRGVDEEKEESHFTPIPLVDVHTDLRPLYFGLESDYFISANKTDAVTARRTCQTLTDLTGKQFHLLILETAQEAQELQSYVDSLDILGVWTAGEKSFDDNGEISVFWATEEGSRSMSFRNFQSQVVVRRRREIEADSEVVRHGNSTTSVMHPWIDVGKSENGRKCKNGRFIPEECQPVECDVLMPECETTTPACTIKNQSDCSITRPECSAKCENCTALPPTCTATPQPCRVITEPCTTIRNPCTVETPECTTTRPPCKTIQPPCELTTPPPCTIPPSKCVPSFEKDNCTTQTFPCTTNPNNETICPEPITVCEPSFKCPPPEVCQSPAIICPPPLIYCEPETTICPEPIITCPKPGILCPPPEVFCPEPEVVCSPPQVICSPPVVNCPGIVTYCPQPELDCPGPIVNCPKPVVNCTEPEPCRPPSGTTPPPCTEPPTTTSTTTERPCSGCGCVVMSKKHEFQWDIERCREEYHFICEGSKIFEFNIP